MGRKMQVLDRLLINLILCSLVFAKISRDAERWQAGNSSTVEPIRTSNTSSMTNISTHWKTNDFSEVVNGTLNSEADNFFVTEDQGLSRLNKKYAEALRKKLIEETWNNIVNLKSRADHLAFIGVNLKSEGASRMKRLAHGNANLRPITLANIVKRDSVDKIISEESKDDVSKRLAKEDLISSKFVVSVGGDIGGWDKVRGKRKARQNLTKQLSQVSTTTLSPSTTESTLPCNSTENN